MSKTLDQLLKEARSFTSVSKHKEAAECYDQMLAIDPKHVDALLGRGMTEQGMGRSREGLAYIERAIEADPNRALAYSRKAMLLKDLGDLEKALECVEKAVSFGPTAPNADIILNEKAIVLRQLGKLEEAIESYKKAAGINPKRSNSYWGMGITQQRLGREEEALETFKTLVSIEPCAMFYLLLGKCYQNLGKQKEALEALSTCVDYYDKGQPGPMLSLGNLNFIKGELKTIKELQAVAAEAEAKAKELEAKAKATGTDNPIVQKFVSQIKNLQADKDKITQTVISKSDKGGASQSDKDELQRIKDEFTKKLAEMEALMQKQMNEVKKDVTTLKKDVAELQKGFAEVKEELDNKLDDFNKKLDKALAAQDLSPEDRTKMKEYYGAFIGTFSSIYVTSQVVDSGQVQLDSNSSVASVLSMIASFTPFIGSALSSGVKSLGDFLQAKEMKTNAKKMKRLANDSTELSQLIGKVAFELASNKKKQQKVINTTRKDLEVINGNLFEKVKKICDKLGEEVDAILYTKLYSSPASRVGHNDANFLIEKWIGDAVKPYDIAEQFAELILDESDNKVVTPVTGTTPAQPRSGCCTMF